MKLVLLAVACFLTTPNRSILRAVAGVAAVPKEFGCILDLIDVFPRQLAAWPDSHSERMTLDFCTSTCATNSKKFAGLRGTAACFCGDQISRPRQLENPAYCREPCTGGGSDVCATGHALHIYALNNSTAMFRLPEETDTMQMLGCVVEEPLGFKQLISDTVLHFPSLRPNTCAASCLHRGFPLAGLTFLAFGRFEAGTCVCGYRLSRPCDHAHMDDCSRPCPGDQTQSCGNIYRTLVYKIDGDFREVTCPDSKTKTWIPANETASFYQASTIKITSPTTTLRPHPTTTVATTTLRPHPTTTVATTTTTSRPTTSTTTSTTSTTTTTEPKTSAATVPSTSSTTPRRTPSMIQTTTANCCE